MKAQRQPPLKTKPTRKPWRQPAAQQQSASRHAPAPRDQWQALSHLMNTRSPETSRHAERVTQLAVHLGQQLGLSEEQLGHLRWGAYLHDIGKLGVAQSVLHKPGPLNTPERREMHQHVTIGETMLRAQGLVPQNVLDIVRHHHERWDGQGYPDQLRSTAIPLLARVFAVVDVYDALTSRRCYKAPWTHLDTLNELRRLAGTHLDPHLVKHFEDLLCDCPHLLRPHTPAESAD